MNAGVWYHPESDTIFVVHVLFTSIYLGQVSCAWLTRAWGFIKSEIKESVYIGPFE